MKITKKVKEIEIIRHTRVKGITVLKGDKLKVGTEIEFEVANYLCMIGKAKPAGPVKDGDKDEDKGPLSVGGDKSGKGK